MVNHSSSKYASWLTVRQENEIAILASNPKSLIRAPAAATSASIALEAARMRCPACSQPPSSYLLTGPPLPQLSVCRGRCRNHPIRRPRRGSGDPVHSAGIVFAPALAQAGAKSSPFRPIEGVAQDERTPRFAGTFERTGDTPRPWTYAKLHATYTPIPLNGEKIACLVKDKRFF